MRFEPRQTLLFIGDSITDAERRTDRDGLGWGYVRQLHDLLTASSPALGLRVLNRGVSGNTVRDLDARWHEDVIAHTPDWLSVKIGINDVWRAFSGNAHDAVPIAEYEATLRDLLERARRASDPRLVLMTPYLIEPDRKQPMRAQMDRFSGVVRELAHAFEATLVDTQAAFDRALQHTAPADWAADQIHPSTAGHAVLALAWLEAVGIRLES